jgi:hypothetical protein
MRSRRTTRFRNLFEQLPAEVQQSARRAYVLFQRDPAHPSLQFKRLRADRQTHSIRVGLGYRALGIRLDEVLVWYWIGPHAEYDRLISQLK